MKKNYWKLVGRTVRQSLNRFLAIFAITALGVGFLTGLLCTAPDMKNSVDRYYDENRMFDLDIKSTMGLTESDKEAVCTFDGVESVSAAYQKDVLMEDESGEDRTVRLIAVDFSSYDDESVCQLTLTEGRLPQKAGECVQISIGPFSSCAAVGDELVLAPDEDDKDDAFFQTETLTVVGIVTSPLYMSTEKESTNVGDGKVSAVYYVDASMFDTDLYTDFFVTLKDAASYDTFSDKYEDWIDDETDRFDSLKEERQQARYDEIYDEASDKLADAQQKFSDGEDELVDAKADLKDAKKELVDAKKELDDAKEKLADTKKKLDDGKKELADAKKELDEAKKKLDDAKSDVEAARKTIRDNEDKIETARASVKEYEAAAAQYKEAKAQLEEAKEKLDEGWASLETAKAAGLMSEEEIAATTAQLTASQTEYEKNEAKLTATKEQLDEKEPQIKEAKESIAQWDENYPKLTAAIKDYENGQKEYKDGLAKYNKSKKEYEDGVKEYEEGKKEYEDGLKEYQDGKKEYQDGLKEYKDGKKKLEKKRKKLADAQKELDDLEEPQWYVLSRNTNVTYASFVSNADKVSAIAKVFPVFFFLVAALVALTTMTRMVEEERTQIGVMKALGYGKGAILTKYMLYAGSAGVTGAVVGVLVGQWGFPTVIWNAYGIMYYYPGFQTAFLAKYAIPSAGASIISVLAATWWAVAESLHDNPARLMLPKAPKEGKRIWLEYVTPVWKHMKFTHKVTARNIFRYKKRFFMTIIGIAGCTALLVTGFGIRDSIGHIVSTQYGEIQKYSLTVELEEDAAKKDVKALKEIIADQSEDYLAVHTETGTVRNGKEEESVTIEVPKDARRFSDFVSLRHRKDQKSVSFDENSVILTEKMADTLGLAVGDTFTLENNDDKTAELTVTEITENYIRGYVYIGKQAWETAFAGNDTEYRTWLVDSGASGDEEEEAQLRTLLSQEAVASASFSSSTIETFDNMLSKIDYIVIVLIFCAGLLAFIVLYNLTNINIGEREKEIATIKVLGFYNGEVNAYIFRETVLLSLFGALVGLVGGFFLHRFVILTVEVSAIMFGRKIFAASYLYAACITMIFTVMVSVVLSRKLKKISMVESMKSVD